MQNIVGNLDKILPPNKIRLKLKLKQQQQTQHKVSNFGVFDNGCDGVIRRNENCWKSSGNGNGNGNGCVCVHCLLMLLVQHHHHSIQCVNSPSWLFINWMNIWMFVCARVCLLMFILPIIIKEQSYSTGFCYWIFVEADTTVIMMIELILILYLTFLLF